MPIGLMHAKHNLFFPFVLRTWTWTTDPRQEENEDGQNRP